MSWSSRRRLLYIGIMAIIPTFILGYFVVQRLSIQPTCFDGERNGEELGVDCGGLCQRLCATQVENLAVLWTRPFLVADDVYNVVAYFENRNVTAGIKEILYEFKLFDEFNSQIGEPFIGSTHIGPNERSVIFESRIKTEGRRAQSAILRFIEEPVWHETDPIFSKPLLTINNRTVSGLDTKPRITADAQNRTLEDFYDVTIAAVVYDADGNAMAASQTSIEEFKSNTSQEIFFVWPVPFPSPVDSIEIIPRVNPFTHSPG